MVAQRKVLRSGKRTLLPISGVTLSPFFVDPDPEPESQPKVIWIVTSLLPMVWKRSLEGKKWMRAVLARERAMKQLSPTTRVASRRLKMPFSSSLDGGIEQSD